MADDRGGPRTRDGLNVDPKSPLDETLALNLSYEHCVLREDFFPPRPSFIHPRSFCLSPSLFFHLLLFFLMALLTTLFLSSIHSLVASLWRFCCSLPFQAGERSQAERLLIRVTSYLTELDENQSHQPCQVFFSLLLFFYIKYIFCVLNVYCFQIEFSILYPSFQIPLLKLLFGTVGRTELWAVNRYVEILNFSSSKLPLLDP